MDIIINDSFSERNILSVLRSLGFSGTAIKRLKQRDCGITVNGEHATVRRILKLGDILSLDDKDSFDDENPNITPTDIPLDILYEDNDVIVINKPPYMPTHPSQGHHTDTLANALCAEYKRRGLPFVFRAVNRLDGDTSGVVLLSKSMLSAYKLAESMAGGLIKKQYLAILDGKIESPIGKRQTIKNYIRRTPDSIIKREVTVEDDGGDLAVTVYECLANNSDISLVSAEPITGRTHQLRVHFSNIGHPITGDDFYGGSLSLTERQALHAYSLSFPLPSSGDVITVTAPLPEDMKAIINTNFQQADKI